MLRSGQSLIALAKDYTKRNLALAQLAHKKIFVLAPLPRFYRQQGNVRALKGFERALFAQLAQRAHIVNARSINEYNRPKGCELQRFFHWVSSCAGRVGNNGNLLSCQCVEQRGLTHITPTIDAYVQAQTFGRFVHGKSSVTLLPASRLPVAKSRGGLGTEQPVQFVLFQQPLLKHHGAHALPCAVSLCGNFARLFVAKRWHKSRYCNQ